MRWQSKIPKEFKTTNVVRFAFTPRLMDCGTWVWLELYYCTWTDNCWGIIDMITQDPLRTIEPIEVTDE